jgi:hypothetical protein
LGREYSRRCRPGQAVGCCELAKLQLINDQSGQIL